MPFPVSVVAKVTTLDSLGHSYETRFRYHNGYYDPIEKQFRGFAQAEQVDVGDPAAPTLVSRSHFDTGRAFQAMKGRLVRLTLEQEDGRVFTDETTQWTTPPETLMTGTNSETVSTAEPDEFPTNVRIMPSMPVTVSTGPKSTPACLVLFKNELKKIPKEEAPKIAPAAEKVKSSNRLMWNLGKPFETRRFRAGWHRLRGRKPGRGNRG